MDEIKYSFKQQGQLHLLDSKPNYNIAFHNNGKEIGKLDFNGPALVFTGDAEESAKVFIDWIARSFHGRLEEERQAAQLAVPDAIHHTDTSETLEYIQGWNDCRATMLGDRP
jgi:hypothetical protein